MEMSNVKKSLLQRLELVRFPETFAEKTRIANQKCVQEIDATLKLKKEKLAKILLIAMLVNTAVELIQSVLILRKWEKHVLTLKNVDSSQIAF